MLFPIQDPDDGLEGSTPGTSTQGAGDQKSPENTSTGTENQYVTPKQLREALTSLNKRVETKLSEQLTTHLGPITEILNAMKAGSSTVEDNPDTQNKPQSNQPSEAEKALIKMQREMAEMQKRIEAKDTEAKEANHRALEERVKAEVLNQLSSYKVEKSDQVYRLIRDKITVDSDTGKITMTVVDPTLGFDEDKDLKTGLAQWLESDDGAHFLPAKGTSGSGVTPGKGGTIQTKKNVSIEDINKMKPSELSKLNLVEIFGEDALRAAMGQSNKSYY